MLKDNFDRNSVEPVLVTGLLTENGLENFLHGNPGAKVINQYESQLEELFLLRHPKYRFGGEYQEEFREFLNMYSDGKDLDSTGQWFYFPWLNYLVHFLSEKEHVELRTGRNSNLITEPEQQKYYNSCIGILGMSVGSHVALTVVMNGGAKYLKIADLDVISGSNLNRIRTGFQNIGLNKVVAVARQVYEINPYAKIILFEKGINEDNLNDFFSTERKIDLLIEEMDNPYLKIRVREKAKAVSVPVIMAADNGDGVIVDIERFDRDSHYPILHDIIKDIKSADLKNILPTDLPKIIAQIAGAQFASKRMLESVAEVGKTLYSWPQLGTAATMCGAVLAGLARRVVLGDINLMSGRFVIDPEKIFVSHT